MVSRTDKETGRRTLYFQLTIDPSGAYIDARNWPVYPRIVDLLLINPRTGRRTYQSLRDSLAAVENPVWVGMLGSFVRARGLNVTLLDANAEGLSEDEVAERVRDINPTLVCVVVYGHNPSASTQVMPGASRACTAIKQLEPERKVLLLGGHVAALPRRTLEEEDCDFTCAGEGAYTLVELVAALKAGVSTADLDIPDLVTPDRPHPRKAKLVANLDEEIPDGAWDLLPMEKYRAHNWHCFGGIGREPYAAIYTTLGCPFKCSFCCIQAPFKSGESAMGMDEGTNSYRYYTPERVLAQIDTLVTKYGVTNIKFADEMFVLNRKFVNAIADGLIERDYGLNIWAYARIDSARDSRTLAKLRRAGFTWLAFGIEAGAADVRVSINKAIEQKLIVETVARVRAAGINIGGNFIFGLPHDNYETMQKTLDLALEMKPEYGNFYSAMAYPGSALYRQAIEAKAKLPETWNGFSQFSPDTTPLATAELSGAQVLGFRDAAFDRFYSDPGYRSMMRCKFGQAALDEIDNMTRHSLKRDDVVVPSAEEAPLLVSGSKGVPATKLEELKESAAKVRATCVQLAHDKKHGHLSSSMSCADVLTSLFGHFLDYQPESEAGDRFIFSKGHGATSLYATLALYGHVDKDELTTYSDPDSPFGVHPCSHMLPALEMSSGSLGHGLGFAAGKALALRQAGSNGRVAVLLGDGECNEGSIWESAMFACAQKLDRLVAIVDNNGIQAVGDNREINGGASTVEKFRSFGWYAMEVDGTDMEEIVTALDSLPLGCGRPCALVARTKLGVSFMEGDVVWHYRVPPEDEVNAALKELGAASIVGGGQ